MDISPHGQPGSEAVARGLKSTPQNASTRKFSLDNAVDQIQVPNWSNVPEELHWFKRFPLDKHPEAASIYWLLGLMDHAGFKFDEA